MCGIVAYIGNQQAYPIVIKGLQRLEYRGYDSAGVAVLNGSLSLYKKKGKVQDLVNFTNGKKKDGTVGLGHTRWATHGVPNDRNAHPHTSGDDRLTLVHNGIIENYASLKAELIAKSHEFRSDTDTEVLVHLIEDVQKNSALSLYESVRMALSRVTGTYAIVVLDQSQPDELVAARKGSPLVIGVGNGEYILVSDASPIVEYTSEVVYLEDESIASVTRNNPLIIKKIHENKNINPTITTLELKLDQIEKNGFDFFMEKEIHEQPNTINACMLGRLCLAKKDLVINGTQMMHQANRITLVACGTSWHAALIGEYLLENLARIPVEVEYASEFRYRNPIISADDLVIAISQSGETADTLAALELAQKNDAKTYGIVNVVGSSIARMADSCAYIHAGPEIGVASTKAFTGQVMLITMLAVKLAYERGTISRQYYRTLLKELSDIPQKMSKAVANNAHIFDIAKTLCTADNALYLGRGYNFPVALEGALKLKEISYIHAEGYPAAEMKHGPIALIDENMPVIVVATNESAHEKIASNIQEVKARKGKVIAIVNENDTTISALADHTITVPSTEEPLTPILSVIPLQLLSYHVAVLRNCNVDQPRNLAKSVTVE